MRWEDLGPRRLEVEPPDPVDLGEFAGTTGARRPLHLEGVAPCRCWIQIPGERPRDHGLPTPLPDLSELEHRAVRRLLPGLFGELAASDSGQLLSGIGLPLQDRPRSLVLLREERTAGMTKEDLEAPVPLAEQEDACAEATGRFRRALPRHRRMVVPSAMPSSNVSTALLRPHDDRRNS